MDIAKLRKKVKGIAQGEQQPADGSDRAVEAPETASPPAEPLLTKQSSQPEPERISRTVPDEETDETLELLTFRLASEEYSFRVSEIEEIIRPQRITKIPKTSSSLLGITALRGKILPVINLKQMLSLKEAAPVDDRKQKILILKGPKGPLGVSVDRVVGIIAARVSTVLETPAHLPEEEKRFLEGVAKMDSRFIPIIRLEEIATIW